MHAIRATSAAVLSLTALTLTAPTAVARESDPFRVSISPTTIAAGGQVTLNASGCSRQTRVSAGIFDTVTIGSGSGSRTATVDWDARQGAVYTVTFTCGRSTRTVDLTIAGGRPVEPTPPPVHHGVRAGVGGSIGGFDLQEIGIGLALITGALGTAYHLARRRTGDDSA
ncbi:hypothetical protein G3I40_22415 [Streptomyces sp. SID14478]|uniref:hypothetical protein n=1 Tax=Streptomyces sp. SID14478 TaxID=2706073 RepID=UPI0013D8F0FB|nr:hypothetical protein [Streptomyces sp. SID14478]NEB77949.1 hypothetical protein [Streptomyces sp. SID14478]